MHPVLEHILARKGKSVPVNDGRKIALVLFGGIMTGVRGTGACIALQELELQNCFDYLYCFSAGFPNAAYFLAGQSRLSSTVYSDDLAGTKFINFAKPWKIADVDYLIDRFRTGEKRLNLEKTFEHPTQIVAGVREAKTSEIRYIFANTLSQDQYFDLLRAAISMPYLHPGITKINGTAYKDIGIDTRNQRLKGVLDSDATDILIIYNYADQNKNTVTNNNRIFEITPPHEWDMSRFETRTAVLKSAAQQMGDLVKNLFGVNEPIKLE